jgi:GT2 family glycosyltransferase
MLECINSTPDAGIVGAISDCQNGPQRITAPESASVEHLDRDARSFRKRNRHRRIPSRKVGGFCMLFKRSLVDKIGFLEERFSANTFATEEFCFRAALEGYKNLIAGDVLIHHWSRKLGRTGTTIHSANKSNDKKLFSEKWGGIDAETALGKKLVSLKILEKAGVYHQRGEIDACIDMLLKGIGLCPEDDRLYHTLSEILIDAEQP